MNKISRRAFIVKGTTLALGTGLAIRSGMSLAFNPNTKSKVVEVLHPDVVNESRIINSDLVHGMVKQGLAELTGNNNTPLSKFINPGDKVGLKINCLGRSTLYTHDALINAMIKELTELGVAENNIIVWDRFNHHMTDCGMKLNDTAEGVRYLATEKWKEEEFHFDQDYIYRSDVDDPSQREEDSIDCRFSNIFTQECDKIINLAILKDHGLAGVTLCLKNIAYGICNNNARFHGPEYIGPFITDIYALPEIREKVVLNVIDGLEACFEQGPVPRSSDVLFTPKTLWFSTDPVALDQIGLEVIEAKRKEKGYDSLMDIRPGINHIELANKAGLGTNKRDEMELIKMELSL